MTQEPAPQIGTHKKLDLPMELRLRLRHSLHTRHFRQGTLAARVEATVKSGGIKLYKLAERRPVTASALVAGAGLVVATSVGAGEITLAMLLGYAAYQVLRERVPPKEAAERMFAQLERAG